MNLTLALLLVISILGAGSAHADSKSVKAIEALGKIAADMGRQQLLDPVIASLRARARQDPKLRSLLGQLDLRVSPLPRAKWGRNAIATYEDERPVVLTDVLFLNEMLSYASLGGLVNSGFKEVGPIAYQVGFNYGAAIGKYSQEGGPFPEFSFSESDLPEGMMKSVTLRLRHEVIKDTIAWIALHEIAHHYLGHLSQQAQTNRILREQEFAADAWAFDTMVQLGYQLWPLDSLFYALEAMEQIRQATGVDIAEEVSDHPTWANRHKALTKRYDVNQATSGLYLTFITFGPGTDGRFKDFGWIIPKNPNEGCYITAISGPDMMAFEWRDRDVVLYGRSPTTREQITLINPERSRFDIEIQEIEVATGRILQNFRSGAWHIDFADLATREIAPGLTGEGLFEKTPIAFALSALTEVRPSAEERSAVKRIYTAACAEQRRSLVAFGKGQIDSGTAEKQMSGSGARAKEQVRTLLGEQRFSRFIEAFLAAPAVQFGIQRLEKHIQSAPENRR